MDNSTRRIRTARRFELTDAGRQLVGGRFGRDVHQLLQAWCCANGLDAAR
jgi:hypothetical protein